MKEYTPVNYEQPLGSYTNNQPFRFWCQKVLPLVYDDSLSYYELLCKVVDYLNKQGEAINNITENTTSLNTAFNELKSYVDNYFTNLDVQTEINNKLDQMVNDGTLQQLLIGVFVRSEEDFNIPNNSYTLINNITITKPIEAFKQGVFLNLNGYTITLSDDYDENYDYIFTYDDSNFTSGQKKLFNGRINMNNQKAYVIKSGLTWRTKILDLLVVNMYYGFWGYIGTPRGAEVSILRLTLYHGLNDSEDYGLTARFGDSVIQECYVVFFKKGIRNFGYSNFYNYCHVWGFPKTTANEYDDRHIMNMGFITYVNNVSFTGCYADTIEPIDITQPASYTNGGVGFLCIAGDITILNCNILVHRQTNNDNHVGIYLYNTSPSSGLPNYEYNVKIETCYITTKSGDYFKCVPLIDEAGTANVLNCFNRNYTSRIGDLEIGFPVHHEPRKGYLHPFQDSSGNPVFTVSDRYYGYLPPLYNFTAASAEILLNKLRSIKNALVSYDLPLFGLTTDGRLFVYNYTTDSLLQISTL